MDNNLNNLKIEINQLKTVLYELIKNGNLTDMNVVQCSKQLDKLILKYQQKKMSN